MPRPYRCLLAAVVVLALTPLAANAINVVVNGQPLPAQPPPVERAGRVLLPMRVVFEALGAQVGWEAATQTAIGTRGEITVRMTINSTLAYINQRPVLLDVPAQLIGGSTYMPVRFPAEAFGAQVGWDGATRTVSIALAPLAPEPPPPLPPPPPPPPPPDPEPEPEPEPEIPAFVEVEGVISAVQDSRMVLTVGQELQTFTVDENTILLRGRMQASLPDLRPGDAVQVRHDALGRAVFASASYELLEGQILAKVPNQLLLDTRPDPLRVQPQVEIRTAAGEPGRYADLRPGDQVTVRLTPGTVQVWEITLAAAPSVPDPITPDPDPDPEAIAPSIDRFYHLADRPLRAGDTLRVTLEGSPTGRAWFTIGPEGDPLNLPELRHQPGRYSAEFRIPASLNAIGVPLLGYLERDGLTAEPAQSAEPVTIDTVAPRLTVFGPTHGERTSNPQPTLAALLTDENGSGVDFERSGMEVRAAGQALPGQVSREGNLLTLTPEPLPVGPVEVVVAAYDRAGNSAQRRWTFQVVPAGEITAQLTVTHDAAGRVLTPGDTLKVVATGPPGGDALFSLGEWEVALPMREDSEQPGLYRGEFVVPELAELRTEYLVAVLHTPDAREHTAQAAAVVQMGPLLPLQPVITQPQPGDQVTSPLVVEGTTQPLAGVTLTLTWSGTTVGILQISGQLAEVSVTADEQGRFASQPLSLAVASLLPVSNVTYKLTAVARGQADEVSEPVEVRFTQVAP